MNAFIRNADDVDVSESRIGALFFILVVSLLAVSFPSISKTRRLSFLRIPPILFFIGKHFGTGVILSTAFVHLLQEGLDILNDSAIRSRWKVAKHGGLIVLGSLLIIFLVEYTSTSFVDRFHSTPSAESSPDSSPERTPDIQSVAPGPDSEASQLAPNLPPTSYGSLGRSHTTGNVGTRKLGTDVHTHTVAPSDISYISGHHRYESRSAHDAHHHLGLKRANSHFDFEAPSDPTASCMAPHSHGHSHAHGYDEEDPHHHDDGMDEAHIGRKRQVVGIIVLQLGIAIHSLVIGLTLSITGGTEFTSLLTAIVFHQIFEGLSLGIRIAALPPPSRLLKIVLTTLFAITAPIGIAIGLIALAKNDGHWEHQLKMKFTQGIMSVVSAGMLIYAACVEMLAADFVMDTHLWRSSIKRQALALVSLLTGVVAMALVGE